MRRVGLLVSFLSLVFSVGAQVPVKDPEAKKVLDKASEKFKTFQSFKADFEFLMESTATGMSEKYTGEVTVKGEKYFIKTGDCKETYNNGETVWTYYVEDNEVTIFDYDSEDDNMSVDKMLNIYKSGYKYRLMADETINGVTYEVVDLEPDLSPEERKTHQVFKIRILFDKKTKIIYSWKIFERNGNRYTVTIKSIQTNIAVSESIFTFDKAKHKGVVEEDLR